MRDELKISLRSLNFRRKQYVSLFLVCVFGVGVSIFSLFLVNGMIKSLEYKAKIYYGGDFQFIGGDAGLTLRNYEHLIKELEDVFPEGTIITDRFDLDAKNASFYFEGNGVRQRVIKGVHFDKEVKLFTAFNYTEGNIENCICEDKNIIMLSEPIAKTLQAHVGDEITFYIKNSWGQIDTRQVVVKAIFKDSSLFGMYTSYTDIDFLKDVYKYPVDCVNRICINLPKSPGERITKVYQKELEKKFQMYSLVSDKKDFYDQLYKIPMPTYALIKLSANLQDVQILIDAMAAISTFVIIMLVIIIVAGVSSTYRVIVMKRINEIGIYKAIGMKRQNISIMLLLETAFIVILGCIMGFLFALILCKVSGLFNLSFIPAFDIFLVGGKLKPVISMGYTMLISCTVIVTTLVAVWFAIKKSVEITPCEALATTE